MGGSEWDRMEFYPLDPAMTYLSFGQVTSPLSQWDLCKKGKLDRKRNQKVASPSESKMDSHHEPSGESLFNCPPEKTIL